MQDDEPTAADVANAPLPGQETGRTDAPEGDSLLRNLAQGVLVPPRIAVEIAAAPVRTSVWAVDRYRLVDRWKQIFFDKTYTYGLYPTVVYDSTYGLTYAARFVHRNLFGEHEHLAFRGATGGEYRALVNGGLRSGDRLGERTQLEVKGEYERRPNDAFFGIGNLDNVTETHHRQELERGAATLDIRPVQSLHVRAAGALTRLSYAEGSSGPPIDMTYDPSMLAGWPGTKNLYGELELRWDHRRYMETMDRHRVYDHGALVSVYAGRVHQLTSGVDYWRYGADADRYFHLGAGPRVLATRLHVEAVSGSYSDVAFTQLPQLGGKTTLRGYPRDRFRDRIATLGSVEYEWDINRYLMTGLFVDVGRVHPEWRELGVDNMRVGYGVEFQFHESRRFIGGVSIASSVDGGVFVDLIFDPIFTVEPRVEQR